MANNPLIHREEFHLISEQKIHDAVSKLVDSLSLAAGSTEGFDIYKVVETYFTDINQRYRINDLLEIPQDKDYYAGK